MNKLALTLPESSNSSYIINSPVSTKFADLGSLLTGLLNIAFYAAVFLAFYYLVWGAVAYIIAQGKKEDLAKARARISWAIIGLMVILLAYFVARFVSEIFPPIGGVPF